jgi:putative oxidoreductase
MQSNAGCNRHLLQRTGMQTTTFSTAQRLYGQLVAIASILQSPLLLAIRLYWGWQFFTTGKGKLLALGQTTEFFSSLGLPFPSVNAFVAGATECFGGLFLLVGLASRLTALPLIFTMLVAYFTADREALNGIFHDPDAFVTATPFLFLFASLLIFVFGPGVFSLDHWLGKKFAAASSESPQPTP